VHKAICAPLFLRGGSTGCLLIHGFTSCPLDVRPLTRHLHSCGYTVREVLLPGHGTSCEDMAKYGWRDWLAAVESELTLLRAQCARVWVVGFSMGGLLAAMAASRQPVQGLVCLAAPIWPLPRFIWLAGLLRHFRRYVDMGQPRQFRFPSWRYQRVAVKNIVDLLQLIRAVRRVLPALRVPALVVQGSADRTVEPRSADYIFAHLSAADKELFVVEGGGHMLLLGDASALVCNRVAHFISCRTGGNVENA